MHSSVSDLLLEAAGLLLIGMLVVFVFLTLVIGAIQLIAWFCRKYPGAAEPQPPAKLQTSRVKTNNDLSDDTVAAISAAVHQYRKAHS